MGKTLEELLAGEPMVSLIFEPLQPEIAREDKTALERAHRRWGMKENAVVWRCAELDLREGRSQ